MDFLSLLKLVGDSNAQQWAAKHSKPQKAWDACADSELMFDLIRAAKINETTVAKLRLQCFNLALKILKESEGKEPQSGVRAAYALCEFINKPCQRTRAKLTLAESNAANMANRLFTERKPNFVCAAANVFSTKHFIPVTINALWLKAGKCTSRTKQSAIVADLIRNVVPFPPFDIN